MIWTGSERTKPTRISDVAAIPPSLPACQMHRIVIRQDDIQWCKGWREIDPGIHLMAPHVCDSAWTPCCVSVCVCLCACRAILRHRQDERLSQTRGLALEGHSSISIVSTCTPVLLFPSSPSSSSSLSFLARLWSVTLSTVRTSLCRCFCLTQPVSAG
ncbi:uncharacterized protein B0I36DRAFT_310823 [Microdochium trichocladiopsis]|uniref:Uncharacterized protein n=1 Tax=Microdochium trichocladiopsis TaxID=1682393 RepID=A0A9P8YJE3_9PEZI|nr:uncharacterized protein B0I36DRAFT_310823 [Microdochium trichocladiopsis]KAH7040501.1 hypothetical protein B0I36DRAFT_310823 [Microdochium trichocladiopsis]